MLCSALSQNANITSLNILGSWKNEETEEQELILPILNAAQNLEELITFDSTLPEKNHPRYSPSFINQVLQLENKDYAIKMLYS